MNDTVRNAQPRASANDYENMRAVSLTLRRAGRAATIAGVVIGVIGVGASLSGFLERGFDSAARELLGVVVLLGGLAAIGLGIIMSAAGESVLALREIALNSRE